MCVTLFRYFSFFSFTNLINANLNPDGTTFAVIWGFFFFSEGKNVNRDVDDFESADGIQWAPKTTEYHVRVCVKDEIGWAIDFSRVYFKKS